MNETLLLINLWVLILNMTIDIDQCHRIGKRKSYCPSTVIIKSDKFEDKQKILRNAKKLKKLRNIATFIKTLEMTQLL